MDDADFSDKDELEAVQRDEESSHEDSGDDANSCSSERKNDSEPTALGESKVESQQDWFTKEENDNPEITEVPLKNEEPDWKNEEIGKAEIKETILVTKGPGEQTNGKKKIKEGKPYMKVVVRRLPPSMTKETFLDQVSPLPAHDYFYFVQASHSVSPEFSRAYINFINQEELFAFTRTFDGYVFLDAKGHEYAAVVEFAPYQRIAKLRAGRKKDLAMGTIEMEPAYITFKEHLLAEAIESSKSASQVKQHYFETDILDNDDSKNGQTDVTTPLIEFIKAKKAEKIRVREEKKEEKRRRDAERKLARQQQKIKQQKQDQAGDGSNANDKNTQDDPADKDSVVQISSANSNQPGNFKVLQKERKDTKDDKNKKSKNKEEKFGKSENRTKEFKNKGGKSYKEERLKQAERREERKKKGEQAKEGVNDFGDVVASAPRPEGESETVAKEEERNWNDKKKWRYGSDGGGSKASGRTFRRRQDDKKRSDSGSGHSSFGEMKRRGGSDRKIQVKSAETLEGSETVKVKETSEEQLWIPAVSDASYEVVVESITPVSKVKEHSSKKEYEDNNSVPSEISATKLESVSATNDQNAQKSRRDSNAGGSDSGSMNASGGADPRSERRIRNKDRPSIEIYRPGMGKFSKRLLDKEKNTAASSGDNSPCHSPSPTPQSTAT